MRTLGLIGGMSWESTAVYYRLLNEGVKERLGGLHSASLLLASCDFAPVAAMQAAGDWDRLSAALCADARRLERAGAEAIVLCTNTMHKLAPDLEAAVAIPVLHIVDATGDALARAGARRPVLLATRFTMEETFWRARLEARTGIAALVPDAAGRALVHRVIYEELCRGIVTDASRADVLAIVDALAAEGADAVILGCTEIGLLIGADDTALPVFDTTAIHARAALDFALG